MDKRNDHKVYQFDGFRVEAGNLMLYRNDRALALPPKAVKTLVALIEHPGEIISKDDLIEAVWKDSIVEESNLSQYLYLLRKTLGKQPDGSAYIETLRRRGYRFAGNAVPASHLERHEPKQARETGRSRQFDVERRGNVLALVDWKEAEPKSKPGPESDLQPAALPKQQRSWKALAGSALLAGLLAVSGFSVYWQMSGAAVATEPTGELTITRLTNGIEVLDATISPDGNYFVYHEPDGKLNRIWLQQTGHATRQEIVPASERIPLTKTFTPDGQFIYFIAMDAIGEPASLYRVATLGGPVTKISTGVGSGVSFSPDGRQMVFARAEGSDIRYVVAASDGSGDERILYTTKTVFGSSAWSPDGKSIAVQLPGAAEGLSCSIAVVDLGSGKPLPLSDEPWDACGRMAWASDGQGIYMVGTRKGDGMTTLRDQIYYISYPQGRSRKITSDGSRHQLASLGVASDGSVLAVPFNRSSQIWGMSPRGVSRTAVQLTTGLTDGRSGIAPLADGRVAFISRIGENLNVWVMNKDGSEQTQLTNNAFAIEEIRSGGDGRFMVFSAYADGTKPHLYRINIDGGGLEQITSGDGYEIDSSISNDGKWVAYDSATVAENKFSFSLWKQPIEGGERVSLNLSNCQMPHFSPDDKYISCVRQQRDILILSAADGALIRTIRVPQSATVQNTLNFGARWTPDGKAVAYIVNNKGVSNIWLQPIDGSEPKRLTDFSNGSIYHFAYSADGLQVFLARGYQIRDAILIKNSTLPE